MSRGNTNSLPNILAATLFLALLFASGGTARAQTSTASPTPSPSPESEELTRLKERNALLEQEKKTAEFERDTVKARKEEQEAKFPKSSATALEGKTTVSDGAVIESQMISYLSMSRAANRIVNRISGFNQTGEHNHMPVLSISNLAIYNERDVNLLLNYKVAKNQLTLLGEQYEQLLPKPVAPSGASAAMLLTGPLSIASSFLGAFVDLTALLRTNVDIKGQTFDIEEAALVSEVFRAVRANDELSKTNLFYPAVVPPNIDANTPSDILTQLENLHLTRARVEKLVGDLDDVLKKIKKAEGAQKDLQASLEEIAGKKKKTDAEIKRLKRIYGPRPPLEVQDRIEKLEEDLADLVQAETKATSDLADVNKKLPELTKTRDDLQKKLNAKLKTDAGLEEAVTRLKALNEQLDKFVSELIKADNTTGMNSLTAYVRAENLKSALPDKNSYWLQLKVLKAGGNNRIKTNLIVDLFNGGNRLTHSGGTIVEYNLFDLNGRSVSSGTLAEYVDYIKATKIKDLQEQIQGEGAASAAQGKKKKSPNGDNQTQH